MKFYLKSAAVLMIAGSAVAAILFLVYEIPSRGSKLESPSVVAPALEPRLIPEQPKAHSLQLIPESLQKDPEPLKREKTIPLEVHTSGPLEPKTNIDDETDISDEQQSEDVQRAPEETNPVDGEWQSRGAKLKQGRKLTILASQLMEKGRFSDASIVLKDAIKMFPPSTKDLSYGEALYKLGICLRRKGEPEQAIPILREAMQFPYYRNKVQREVEAATGQLQRTKLNQTRG